jgi:hypothetical protein
MRAKSTSIATPRSSLAYPAPPGFNGRLLGLYRWFSGRPMNGHRYTDATGFRYGTMATDLSGRATMFQLLPGYKRFLYARLPITTSPALAVLLATGHVLELAWLLSIAVLLAVPSLAKVYRTRRFRREVTEPVAKAVANVLRVKHVARMGHTWVDIPVDWTDDPLAKITVWLPQGWTADRGDKERLVQVIGQRVHTTDLVASWDMSGHAPSVQLAKAPAPVDSLGWWAGVADVSALAKPGQTLAMGRGVRDKVVTFDLASDSPHLLIAGGSGAGKSEFLAYLIGQFMRTGHGVAVLDAKYVSHMWARRIPGVLYASEDAELHEALIWLDAELKERARFVASGGDPATLKPLVAVLEEMGAASNRLRSYWASIKITGDPMMSPALSALMNLSSMGRELRMHVLMAGQSLTAKVTGGPENRENFAGRALARATAAQWKMLAPQIKPAPTKRGRPGRWHLVVGDTLAEFQVPFADLKNEAARLIEWATGGEAFPDVPAMLAGWQEGRGDDVTAPEQGIVEASVVASSSIVSLRTFCDNTPGADYQSMINWRQRHRDFPVESGMGANRTKLYERDHLRDFLRARLREPATADEA